MPTTRFGRPCPAEIEALGKTVEYIDFSAHSLFGGAMRCKTGILSRYDD